LKYIKYYVLQLVMIATMLVFAFAFAEFSMGRDTSVGVIALYIALSVFYLFISKTVWKADTSMFFRSVL